MKEQLANLVEMPFASQRHRIPAIESCQQCLHSGATWSLIHQRHFVVFDGEGGPATVWFDHAMSRREVRSQCGRGYSVACPGSQVHPGSNDYASPQLARGKAVHYSWVAWRCSARPRE